MDLVKSLPTRPNCLLQQVPPEISCLRSCSFYWVNSIWKKNKENCWCFEHVNSYLLLIAEPILCCILDNEKETSGNLIHHNTELLRLQVSGQWFFLKWIVAKENLFCLQTGNFFCFLFSAELGCRTKVNLGDLFFYFFIYKQPQVSHSYVNLLKDFKLFCSSMYIYSCLNVFLMF